MVRSAYLHKHFDFKAYDPRDAHDRLRLSIVLSDLANQASCKAYEHLLGYQKAVLQVSSDENKPKVLQDVYNLTRKLIQIAIPWEDLLGDNGDKSAVVQQNQSTYEHMFDEWKTIWGDPQDPAVQERIEKTAKWLMDNNQGRGLL